MPNDFKELSFFERLLPEWSQKDSPSRELDEEYEAVTVVPDNETWGEALRSGQKMTGTGIPLKEVR